MDKEQKAKYKKTKIDKYTNTKIQRQRQWQIHKYNLAGNNFQCCKNLLIKIFGLVGFLDFLGKNNVSLKRKLFKTMLDFFFCQVQLHIELYYNEEKSRKNPNIKI